MRVPQVVQPDHRQGIVTELGAAACDVPGELPGHMLGVAVLPFDVAEDQGLRPRELELRPPRALVPGQNS